VALLLPLFFLISFSSLIRPPLRSPLFPYTTLFRSGKVYLLPPPAQLVRVRGMAPLFATIYELERLRCNACGEVFTAQAPDGVGRSEEHTSELQSRENLVCRLLLEKKKNTNHCQKAA